MRVKRIVLAAVATSCAVVVGTETPCGANTNPDVINPTCATDILYTPISVVLNSWGYSLEVG